MSAALALLAIALFAMLIELCIGYPERLVRVIGHPVTWIGALIGSLDRLFNRDMTPALRRLAGTLAVAIALGVVGAITFVAQWQLLRLPFGVVPAPVLASALIAQRSLHRYVANVASALELQDLDAGRKAVSHIVCRDTARLDRAGIARAAIESLAENFSDGIVASIVWLVVAGLPGAALYKAINTADSMSRHRTPRYADFGWTAPRLDELVNFPAPRPAAPVLIPPSVLRADASAG